MITALSAAERAAIRAEAERQVGADIAAGRFGSGGREHAVSPYGCELCELRPWRQRDDVCWVTDCRTCGVPLVVWRDHGTDPDAGDVAHMLDLVSRYADERFAGRFYLDEKRRTIPDHWHAHARPGPAADRVEPVFESDPDPVVGWRIWGDVRFDFGVDLVSPLQSRNFPAAERALNATATGRPARLTDSWWDVPRKTAGPCWVPGRTHAGGYGDGCHCGLYAYRSVEDMAVTVGWDIAAVSVVAGHGPVHWSLTDHRRYVWRTQRMTVENIVLPASFPADRARQVETHFGVPVLQSAALDEGGGRTRWVEFARWADAKGLPNVWKEAPDGRPPTGVDRLSCPFPMQIGSQIVRQFPPEVGRSNFRGAVSGTGSWLSLRNAAEYQFFDAAVVEDPWLSVGALWPEFLWLAADTGFTHVLDLAAEHEPPADPDSLGVHHLRLPTPDDGTPKPPEWFRAGIDFAREARSADGRLLVHCAAGKHRSPSMVYAILRAFGDDETTAWRKVIYARTLAGGQPRQRANRYRDSAERAIAKMTEKPGRLAPL